MKHSRRFVYTLLVVTFASVIANAQVRQTHLYVDDGSGNFSILAGAAGGGSLTLPASGTLLSTGNLTSITSVGTIGSGTWQGNAIAPTYGGTGLNTSATVTGSILYTSSAGTWTTLAPGANTDVLTLAGGVPTWAPAGSGSGTVTSFSSGNLSPLFTTSVATQTTTPALSFTLSSAAAHTFLGNNTGSSTTPSYTTVGPSDLTNNGGTASSTTFYRGDGHWATPGSGTVANPTGSTYTVLTTDALVWTNSSSITITLPAANSVAAGHTVYYVNYAASTTTGISLTGSDHINDPVNGGLVTSLSGSFFQLVIVSDGSSHWFIASSN